MNGILHRRRLFWLSLILSMVLVPASFGQTPLGSQISYQGFLQEDGVPAGGLFDFQVNLFDDEDPLAGTLLGTQTLLDVPVDSGLFHLELDFGEVFVGDLLWLEIRVRRVGSPVLVSLAPLQPILSTANALRSHRADQATVAGNADLLDGLDSGDFLTLEVDPTVAPEVKDGVSWNELSAVPPGFADGTDDIGAGIPVGTVVAFAGAEPPDGWLLCDGSEVSRVVYAELFGVLAGTWGIGDGIDTFNLPDLRGRAPIGSGIGESLTPRVVGENGGAETHTLTVEEMPSHRHRFGITTGDQNGGIGVRFVGNGNNVSTSVEGGDLPHNNMQPFAVVHYIVKH